MPEKVYIDATEVREVVSEQLGEFCGTIFSLYVADAVYYCPTIEEAERVIQESNVARDEYIAEVHDCDDFARLLVAAFIRDAYKEGRRRPAYCFGLILTGGHAFNWFVDDRKIVRLVEPQTGDIFGVEKLDDAVMFMLV